MAEKPTVDEIRKLYKDRKDYYYNLHEKQKSINKYYELDFDAGIPTKLGYEQITPPSARDWIDVGVRHFTLDNPKAQAFPRGNSDTSRAKDAVVESFLNFWLRRIIFQIKDAAKKLPLRGEAFLKLSMDDTYLGIEAQDVSEEEKKELRDKRLFHFPLKMTVVDPVNVYSSPVHDGLCPADVIECFGMTVAEAQSLCERNGWDWKTEKKSTKIVYFLSYISSKWRCFMFSESETPGGFTPVLKPEVQPNILGFCPYVHIPSGYGNSDYEGKPESLYRSILDGKQDMLRAECRMLSQIDALNARFAWWLIKVIGEEEDVKVLYPDGKVKLSPGEIIRESEQVKVEILKGENPPSGLFQELAAVSARAQPPAVLAGTRPTGVYSGQAIEDLISTSKPLYKSAFKNLEDGLAVVMGMGLRILDKVYKHEVAIEDMSSEEK